ncbi:MAG: LytTR family DNA-binding domain-containing protein [Lysobacterales bacterium]|nr:response regulator transcription factor [Xanthomonadales bacterium]MCP5477001.1 response regulator transcription factor [Rhodanobacteraceae bacterium]
MKVLIVDDEPLARRRMASLLAGVDGVELVGEAADGQAALVAVDRHDPDLVLLDIRMPGIDGLEVARRLSLRSSPPAVVFCTAYDEHALAAFDADAVDYLLKPIRRERLLAALERVRRFNGETPNSAAAGEGGGGRHRSHICARVRGEMKLIPISAVAYFLADAKYVEVHYDGGEVLIEDSLVSLEEEFGERFVRVHRNCLVARERIEALGKLPSGETTLRLRGRPENLEVSRRNLPQLRRFLRGL